MAKSNKKSKKIYLPMDLPDYKDFGGVIGDIGKSAANALLTPLEIASGSNFFDPKMDTKFGVGLAKGANAIEEVGEKIAPTAMNLILPGSGTVLQGTQALGSQLIGDNTSKGNMVNSQTEDILEGVTGIAGNVAPMLFGGGGKIEKPTTTIRYQGVEMNEADAKALYEARKAYNQAHATYKSKGDIADSKYALSLTNLPAYKTINNLSTKYNIPLEVDTTKATYGTEGDVNKYSALVNYELPVTTPPVMSTPKAPTIPIDPNYQYQAKTFIAPNLPPVEPTVYNNRTGFSAQGAKFLGTDDTYQPELLEQSQGPIVTGMKKKAMGGPLDMTMYEGPRHEDGGIKLGTNTEVEGGEARVQDYIFSDRLTPKGMDKTFATIAKDINRKYGKRENDAPSERAKAKELNSLMLANEQARIEKEEMESQEMLKYGGYLKYDNGGIFIDPSKRGSFTRAAKERGMGVQEFASKVLAHKNEYDSSMVRKANFAHNAASWKHADGGPWNMNENWNNTLDNLNNTLSTIPIVDPNYRANPITVNELPLPEKQLQLPEFATPGINPNTTNMPQEKAYDFFDPNNKFGAKEAGLIASNLGATYNLAKGMSKPATTTFERFTPEEISLQAERNAIEKKTDMARRITSQNIRNNATSSGQALSNLAASNSALTANEIDRMSNSYANEENANKGIRNQAGMYNTNIANQEVIANEQNKAMQQSLLGLGLANIGTNTQGYMRDKGMQRQNTLQNQEAMSIINAMFPHYKWGTNPEQDGYMIEFANNTLKKGANNG